MSNVIYVDILLMINLLVNFLMLSAAGLLVKTPTQLAHFALRRDRCGLFIDNLSARYESVLFDSLASYLFCGDAFHRVLYTLG